MQTWGPLAWGPLRIVIAELGRSLKWRAKKLLGLSIR